MINRGLQIPQIRTELLGDRGLSFFDRQAVELIRNMLPDLSRGGRVNGGENERSADQSKRFV